MNVSTQFILSFLIIFSSLAAATQKTIAGKEIEIKFQIPDTKAFSTFKNFVIKHSARERIDYDHTQYYFHGPKTEPVRNAAGHLESPTVLRYDGWQLCWKTANCDEQGKTISREEVEFQVDDKKNLFKLLEGLGYSPKTEIKKYRHNYYIPIVRLFPDIQKGDFEVAFDRMDFADKVFIEVELHNVDSSMEIKKANELLRDFLKKSGLREIIEYDCGYITIVWNPTIHFGKLITL